MTQSEALQTWWNDADEDTRTRALQLDEGDLLPPDLLTSLVRAYVVPSAAAYFVNGENGSGIDGFPVSSELSRFLKAKRTERA